MDGYDVLFGQQLKQTLKLIIRRTKEQRKNEEDAEIRYNNVKEGCRDEERRRTVQGYSFIISTDGLFSTRIIKYM
jgi:hypothetical protein